MDFQKEKQSLFLTFEDKEKESSFTKEFYAESLPNILMALGVGNFLYAFFILIDYYYYPHLINELLTIRIIIISIISISSIILRIKTPSIKLIQTTASTVVISAGVGIAFMLGLSDPSIGMYYFPGMMLVFLFNTSFLRQRFVYAIGTQIILLLITYLVYYNNPYISVREVILQSFFLVSATIIGAFNSYLHESNFREAFLYRRKIAEQNGYMLLKNSELNLLNEEKDDLFRWVVHDLRNPLMVINGYLRIIDRKTEGAEKEIKITEQTTKKIEEMVSDLLRTNQLEQGRIEFTPEKKNLTEVINEVIKENQVLIEEKEIDFSFPHHNDEIVIDLDAKYFKVAFNNIISNALKYTPKERKVEVSLKKEANEIILSVKDQGVGIPDNEVHKLFKKFGTTSSRPTNGERSSGLGLYIVKKIMEAMHGDILYERNELGGSTFRLKLPFHCDKTSY